MKLKKIATITLAGVMALGLLSACSGTGEDESTTTENVEETDTVTETEEPVVDETDEPEETDESDTTETTDETVEDELTVAEVMAINEDGSYSLTLYTLTEGAEAPTDYAAIDYRTGGVGINFGIAVDGEQYGQGSFHTFYASVNVAGDGDRAVRYGLDAGHVGHLVQVELLRYLRAYLGRIAVDGLAAANDDVGHADLADGHGERIARSQRVGAGEGAVGQQVAVIGSAVESFADDFSGAGRAHGQDADRRAGMLLLKAQGLFERIEVFGVKDRRQSCAVDRPFGGHGVLAHIARIGHLLCEHYYFQTHCLLFNDVRLSMYDDYCVANLRISRAWAK